MIKYPAYLPLWMILAYIITGVVVSFFGPVAYADYDKVLIFYYIAGFAVLFTLGYKMGVPKNYRTYNPIDQQKRSFALVIKVVKICLIIFSLTQAFLLLSAIAGGGLTFSLDSIGDNYIGAYEGYERNSGNYSLSFIIQTVTYIPYLISVMLGLYFFKQLPTFYKGLVLWSIGSIIVYQTIGTGKQKQIADVFIILIIMQVLQFTPRRRAKIGKGKMIFAGCLGVGLVCALLFILSSRYEALGVDIYNVDSKLHPLMTFEKGHWIFSVFGEKLGLPMAFLSSYLSQGYYGLSLAMQETFVWTKFAGNSYSLTVFLERFAGLPLDYRDSYPLRTGVSSGWGETKWYSAFAWFAGDFTFIGTLFVFGLFAMIYARVWFESFVYRNPISLLLFINLTIGFIYIPANNQLLHTPGSVLAMFAFLAIWLTKGQQFNFPVAQMAPQAQSPQISLSATAPSTPA